MIELSFPWPPRELSPNARVHWSKKAKAAKKYKEDCRLIYRLTMWDLPANALLWGAPGPALAIAFHPPSARRIDPDNCLARFKAGIDAISQMIGIDDSKFTIQFSKAEPVKFGAVRVVIA